MRSVRIIYQLARADFLERVRRYSFLVMLGLVLFLGYQTANGNLTLHLNQYRGEFNSAWIGVMMASIAAIWLGWFGFFIIKGSVTRDRETGVGQIIATTPLSRPLYMLGKWLSNLAVLTAMVAVLAIAGIGIQFWTGESSSIDVYAYFMPFLLVTFPMMAMVAAVAVLFESVSFLRGGFGNVVYFIGFLFIFALFRENAFLKEYPLLDPTGLNALVTELGQAAREAYPDYSGGFSFGPIRPGEQTFLWLGINWTLSIVLARVGTLFLAMGITGVAALLFDRFDPSRSRPRRTRSVAGETGSQPEAAQIPLTSVHLTPLGSGARRFSFLNVLRAEMKLLIKGRRWWWYAIAAGLAVAGVANTAEVTREIVLPMTWIWPILVWSAIGSREISSNVHQMTFSSASPLFRQFPAQWLAAFIFTLIISAGAIVRLSIDGDAEGMIALMSGAIFIPSLAIASGVWSRSSKLFEIVYILIWYLGPLNKVIELDYIGSHGSGSPGFFIPLSIGLVALAAIGRARQIRS